ncbi:hypothetical protein B0A48_13658 [Cryoendolithus antarcticus]|uniref:Arrestin C-terminal-like domain-containing protein n=1 Tax=Cryoendolithus antarcticus TaxID=1507870 RepID=A0A1V8SPE3_9PEZI|nr:hypothetical protein B0A48_13658 [Cryoendolithus antarcticus]
MDGRRIPPQNARTLPPTLSRAVGTAVTATDGMRPLSDIREITEPSLIDMVSHVKRRSQPESSKHVRSKSNPSPLKRETSVKRKTSVRIAEPTNGKAHRRETSVDPPSSSYSSTPPAPSCYAIPLSSVPRRSSSQAHTSSGAGGHDRKASTGSGRSGKRDVKAVSQVAHFTGRGIPAIVPAHGISHSPVKHAGLRHDPITSDSVQRPPSKTLVRDPKPAEIVDFPTFRHPRLKVDLQVSAPLCVGGGTIEGHVTVVVDDKERVKSRRTLGIAALSVDLLGFEEIDGGRRATFMALGTELLDREHRPPSSMVEPDNPLSPEERWWTLKPCVSSVPFMVNLPLDTGPPPFQSKHAKIRFILSATALIKDAGKQYRVRSSQDVCVLPTYDPEKALISLPSPLTATDELVISHWNGSEVLAMTAGLHRQIWVSGSSLFVDLHIANRTRKTVKRVELHLERNVLCYKHGPVETPAKSHSQTRIFDSNDKLILAKSKEEHSDHWTGICPYTSTIRTCKLEVPRGHATVRCGKYFEVRYFLNVTASLSNSKLVSVQLPVILIHMNSLDVLPNSVAQVAAAIEQKRGDKDRFRLMGGQRQSGRRRSVSTPPRGHNLDRKPSYTQGRAFAAPRQQSLDRQRAAQAQMQDLRHRLESSPRKHPPLPISTKGVYLQKLGSSISFGALSTGDKSSTSGSMFGSIRYHTPPRRRQGWQIGPAIDAEAGGLRERLRRLHSANSMHSKKSTAHLKHDQRQAENLQPLSLQLGGGMRKFHIAPHTLGLASSAVTPAPPDHISRAAADDVRPGTSFSFQEDEKFRVRPSTSLSFREKLDRSRFAMRRKKSKVAHGNGKLMIERVKQRDVDETPEWI